MIQFIILAQPLLWMNLIQWDWVQFREGIRYTFYNLALFSLVIVYKRQIHMGFYTTSIIMQYIILTVIAFYLYDQRFNLKESICLAFLTVWLNSYYWELPLHINEVLSVGFHVGMLVQLTRLIPLLYFIPNYSIGARGKRLLLLGFGYSGATMVVRVLRVLPWYYSRYLYIPNRLICLLFLVKVIIEADKKVKILS